jgi:hypothetical protein
LWNRSIDNEIMSYQTQGSSTEPQEVSIMFKAPGNTRLRTLLIEDSPG